MSVTRRALVIAAAVPLPASVGLAAPPDAPARVDKVFEKWETTESPGCAVAVAESGKTVLSRAYGMSDLERDTANTADTVFEAGSVSKQFTAAAVMLLARDAKLWLDDAVRKYIPELPDYGAPLTVRHMLTHTSGLRDWGAVVAAAGWPRGTRTVTHGHVLEVLSRQKALNFPSGTEFSYSNSGYNPAAILVSRVAGKSFADFTRERIFIPLGMTRTEWRDDYTRIVKGRATAYSKGETGWHMAMPFENAHGNGGLLTTVGDLLRWNAALDAGTLAGPDFAAEQQKTGTLADGRPIRYGMGLYAETWKGAREVSHGGATGGYRAVLARYPDHGLSVAVLCNADNANAGGLGHEVADVFLEGKLAAPPAPTPGSVAADVLQTRTGTYRHPRTGGLCPRATGVIAPAARAAYAGRYVAPEADAILTVAIDGEDLVVRQGPDWTGKLIAVDAAIFTVPSTGTFAFDRGRDGKVTGLRFYTGRLRGLRFQREEGRR